MLRRISVACKHPLVALAETKLNMRPLALCWIIVLWMGVFWMGTFSVCASQGDDAPVKIFVLAGQSNMVGQAVVDLTGKDYNEGRGTLLSLWNDPAKRPLFAHLRNEDRTWRVRDDAFVRYQLEDDRLLKGPLGIGFTAYSGTHHFGPELQFGHVVADAIDEPILIIKTAWGGKSLMTDFRPPSAGGDVGHYYSLMLREVREAIEKLDVDFPQLSGRRTQLAGFVWYQGWNDGVDPQRAVPEYEQNLVHLIGDVRKAFQSPQLPVVIGELTGPWREAPGAWNDLRKAQAAAAHQLQSQGPTAFVETHDFVRNPEDSPNPTHGHHEYGNAETYFLVGDALGKAMCELLEK